MVRLACPRRVDVRAGVEDGEQVLPFAGITIARPTFSELAEFVAFYGEVVGTIVAACVLRMPAWREGVEVWHFES